MRFIWYLCKEVFHTTPDDERITDMDPVQKLFMYENWLADRKDDAELAKNHAYLLASFWNPEAVKQLVDGGNTHESTEDEFEESSRMVTDSKLADEEERAARPRRRRHLKG
jgi:hypothetical protein